MYHLDNAMMYVDFIVRHVLNLDTTLILGNFVYYFGEQVNICITCSEQGNVQNNLREHCLKLMGNNGLLSFIFRE